MRAPEPATLYRMHGSLSGAYRVRERRDPEPRRAHEHDPVRPQPRFRRPAALPRRSSGRWRSPRAGSASTRSSSRAGTSFLPTEMPYRTPSGALYDSGDYEACLDRALELAGLRRAAARAARRAPQGGSSGSDSPASSSPRSRTWATSRSPRRRRARRRRCRSRGTPRARRSRSTHSAVSRSGSPPHRRARGTATVCAQVVADVLGLRPRGRDVLSELDTASDAVDCGSGQLLVALLRRRRSAAVAAAGAARCGEARRDPRRTAGATTSSLRRVAGMAHWNPEGCPKGWSRASPRWRSVAAPNLDPPDDEDRVASSARARLHRRRRARSRSSGRPGGCEVLDYVTVARRRPPAQPAPRRRAGARRVRPRRGGGALRAHRLRRGRQPPARPRSSTTSDADRARHPAAPDRPPLVAVAVHGARREGARRGEHDVGPRRDRERGRRRARPRRRRAAARPRRASGSSSRTAA